MTEWADHMLALALVVALPLYGYLTYPKFKREIAAGKPGVRVWAYLETLAIQWILTIATLMAWWWFARPAGDIGLAVPWSLRFALIAGLTALLIVTLVHQVAMVYRGLPADQVDQLRGKIHPLRHLMPQTPSERNLFLCMAVTAGICEEILYRGFLIWYIAHWTPSWVAAAIAILIFGAGHLYQGEPLVLKAILLGCVATALYLVSGSLFPAVLLHATLDIQGGLIAYRVRSLERPA
jgi:membrane protease YdiL (CAAX protease family)